MPIDPSWLYAVAEGQNYLPLLLSNRYTHKGTLLDITWEEVHSNTLAIPCHAPSFALFTQLSTPDYLLRCYVSHARSTIIRRRTANERHALILYPPIPSTGKPLLVHIQAAGRACTPTDYSDTACLRAVLGRFRHAPYEKPARGLRWSRLGLSHCYQRRSAYRGSFILHLTRVSPLRVIGTCSNTYMGTRATYLQHGRYLHLRKTCLHLTVNFHGRVPPYSFLVSGSRRGLPRPADGGTGRRTGVAICFLLRCRTLVNHRRSTYHPPACRPVRRFVDTACAHLHIRAVVWRTFIGRRFFATPRPIVSPRSASLGTTSACLPSQPPNRLRTPAGLPPTCRTHRISSARFCTPYTRKDRLPTHLGGRKGDERPGHCRAPTRTTWFSCTIGIYRWTMGEAASAGESDVRPHSVPNSIPSPSIPAELFLTTDPSSLIYSTSRGCRDALHQVLP